MRDWTEDDAQEVVEASHEAGELLHTMALRFLVLRKHNNPTLSLLGLQMSLLNEAARMALIQKDVAGAHFTKASFGRMAREAYAEVARYRAKKPPPPPKFKVVK